jgi:hypothetical protein
MAKELNHIKLINVNASVSVSNTSTLLLSANSRRLYAEIVNTSDTGIWINFGAAAAVGTGMYIAPAGFSFVIDSDFMWRGSVYGISAGAAGKLVSVVEGQ